MIFRDTFGNLITNIHADRLGDSSPESWEIEIAGERILGIGHTYGERPAGTLIALLGSSGWVEVAVVNGDAARHLIAGAGTTVRVRRRVLNAKTRRVASRRLFRSPARYSWVTIPSDIHHELTESNT